MQLNDVTKVRQARKSEDGHDGYMVRFPDGRLWIFHDHFGYLEWRRMFADKISHLDLRRTQIRLVA